MIPFSSVETFCEAISSFFIGSQRVICMGAFVPQRKDFSKVFKDLTAYVRARASEPRNVR